MTTLEEGLSSTCFLPCSQTDTQGEVVRGQLARQGCLPVRTLPREEACRPSVPPSQNRLPMLGQKIHPICCPHKLLEQQRMGDTAGLTRFSALYIVLQGSTQAGQCRATHSKIAHRPPQGGPAFERYAVWGLQNGGGGGCMHACGQAGLQAGGRAGGRQKEASLHRWPKEGVGGGPRNSLEGIAQHGNANLRGRKQEGQMRQLQSHWRLCICVHMLAPSPGAWEGCSAGWGGGAAWLRAAAPRSWPAQRPSSKGTAPCRTCTKTPGGQPQHHSKTPGWGCVHAVHH